MSIFLKPGPYRTIPADDGLTIPYYIIPFDEFGRCEAPRTRADLLSKAKDYSDIFIFSHGWNNDWRAATSLYEGFISNFTKLRKKQRIAMRQDYRPLLVGVFWPSAILVHDWEKAPKMASSEPGDMDAEQGEMRQVLTMFRDAIAPDKMADVYALMQRDTLEDHEALDLAKMLASSFTRTDDEIPSDRKMTPEDLVKVWKQGPNGQTKTPTMEEFGTEEDDEASEPGAAGALKELRQITPRNIARAFTVWKMKDRAGTVGTIGVGPLLRELMRGAPNARAHLIGHSYGGKVVLSALCSPDWTERKVHSLLLLQPAVCHLCFASEVPNTKHSGGYRKAIERVEKPIFTTYSKEDFPLTKVFHWALRRPEDKGEAKIAAFPTPPDQFAALGGYGPRLAGEKLIHIQKPGQEYELDKSIRIYGLNGSNGPIKGHGDISNDYTYWALHNLVRS